MRFYYSDLKALTPGTASSEEWKSFVARDALPASEEMPPCPVPVMLRRRMTPLGRLALTVLADIGPRDQEEVVYASSWGEIGRTAELLDKVAEDPQAMSPAGFASSVHNAVAGIASIWKKNHTAGPAVSAGTLTTEAALIQCWATLAAGASSVILLRYDEPLPEEWRERRHRFDAPERMFAWGMRLTAQPQGSSGTFALEVALGDQADIDECAKKNWPGDLAFLSGDRPTRMHTDYSARGYRWAR